MSKAEAYTAFKKAQEEFQTAKKNATNPHFKSKYADLSSVLEASLPALHTNGFVFSQSVGSDADGAWAVTRLLHVCGEEIVSDRCFLPVPTKTPQAYGSAITYARRYSASSFLGLETEDDDANAASAKPLPVSATPKATATQPMQPPVDPLVLKLWLSIAAKCTSEAALLNAWNTGLTKDQKLIKELRESYTARVREVRAAKPAAPTEAA